MFNIQTIFRFIDSKLSLLPKLNFLLRYIVQNNEYVRSNESNTPKRYDEGDFAEHCVVIIAGLTANILTTSRFHLHENNRKQS